MLCELPDFEYYEPSSLAEALETLAELGPSAKILAGGTDLLGLMKDRIHGRAMPIPLALVNVKHIAEMKRVEHDPNESRFGAAVTLSQIASDLKIDSLFSAFSQAARSVATGQIRNMGTLGGNLCQRPWCWYFRHPAFDCFKKGGKQCYAITGDNSTYFSVYNIGTCVMAHPSDTAPALISLGAKVKIQSAARGTRDIPLSDFFLGPKSINDNVLEPDEILTSVAIPLEKKARSKSVYLKHRIRDNWDFALASVAACASVDESTRRVEKVRLVLGGVAPFPIVMSEVEQALCGEGYGPRTKEKAIELVLRRAKPLRMNRYKVRIVKTIVSRALDAVLT